MWRDDRLALHRQLKTEEMDEALFSEESESCSLDFFQ